MVLFRWRVNKTMNEITWKHVKKSTKQSIKSDSNSSIVCDMPLRQSFTVFNQVMVLVYPSNNVTETLLNDLGACYSSLSRKDGRPNRKYYQLSHSDTLSTSLTNFVPATDEHFFLCLTNIAFVPDEDCLCLTNIVFMPDEHCFCAWRTLLLCLTNIAFVPDEHCFFVPDEHCFLCLTNIVFCAWRSLFFKLTNISLCDWRTFIFLTEKSLSFWQTNLCVSVHQCRWFLCLVFPDELENLI